MDVDPKAAWALNHLDLFPVEVNTAPLEVLLRVPGMGPRGARLIMRARRTSCLREGELRKLGIAFKRARYFITCNGKYQGNGVEFCPEALRAQLASPIEGGRHGARSGKVLPGQLSLFGSEVGRTAIGAGDKATALDGSARGAQRLQAPVVQEGVVDGIFGWQHALQGRQKVPA